ncbi:hypothetical protein WI664_15710, partial [Vibrio cholerae]
MTMCCSPSTSALTGEQRSRFATSYCAEAQSVLLIGRKRSKAVSIVTLTPDEQQMRLGPKRNRGRLLRARTYQRRGMPSRQASR